MCNEYVSIFQMPMKEQTPLMEEWLNRHVGTINRDWSVRSSEVMCVQITVKQHKHKRMFDLYAELQGITVYDTLEEFRTAQMLKFRGKVGCTDEDV